MPHVPNIPFIFWKLSPIFFFVHDPLIGLTKQRGHIPFSQPSTCWGPYLCWFIRFFPPLCWYCPFTKKTYQQHMGMDQYLLIPFFGGWTSIYQLFWCSPGVQGFDTLPYQQRILPINHHWPNSWRCWSANCTCRTPGLGRVVEVAVIGSKFDSPLGSAIASAGAGRAMVAPGWNMLKHVKTMLKPGVMHAGC